MRPLPVALLALALILVAPSCSAAMVTPGLADLEDAVEDRVEGIEEALQTDQMAVTPNLSGVGSFLDDTVPQTASCDPVLGCRSTRNNFEAAFERPSRSGASPEAVEEAAAPAPNATKAQDEEPQMLKAPFEGEPLQEMPVQEGAPGPALPPQPDPASQEGSPDTTPHASLVQAPAGTGSDTAWALATAAFALPGALLAKLASILALRRSSRSTKPSLREDVLDAVAKQPGIRHRELVRRIGHGNGTVEHHVRALLAEGKVARVRHGGSTAYFVAGGASPDDVRLRLALEGGTSRRLALDVAAHPGSRLTDVARRVGVSLATAHYQAGKLVAAGVLRDTAAAGSRKLEATPAGQAFLATVAGEGPAPAASFGGPVLSRSGAPSPA